MTFTIEVEQEDDGRWLADAPDLPGVWAYGNSSINAVAKAQALGLRLLADQLERGDPLPGHFHSLFEVKR